MRPVTIPTELAEFTERLLGGGLVVDDYAHAHDGVGGSTFTLYLVFDSEGTDLEDPDEYVVYADSMDHRWYLEVDRDTSAPSDVLLPEGDVSDTLTAIALTVKEER